jgi:uncharacterized protein (DUF1778 family)
MLNKSDIKSDSIHLRIDPHCKDLINRAAQVVGKNRSAFMLDAASETAERVLLDQTLFRLDSKEWEDFNNALDKAPTENKKLRELLTQKSPWEEK